MRKYLTLSRAFIAVIILQTASFIYDLIEGKESLHTYGLHVALICMLICVLSYQRLVDTLTDANKYFKELANLQEQQIDTLQHISNLKDGIIEIRKQQNEKITKSVETFLSDADEILANNSAKTSKKR